MLQSRAFKDGFGSAQIPFAQQPWKKLAPLASELNVKHMFVFFSPVCQRMSAFLQKGKAGPSKLQYIHHFRVLICLFQKDT